jgi:hypothetical protein
MDLIIDHNQLGTKQGMFAAMSFDNMRMGSLIFISLMKNKVKMLAQLLHEQVVHHRRMIEESSQPVNE